MKKVTFITTAQPTTNPRLVKEAEYLKNQGFEVKVIVCFYEKWAAKFDADILSKNPGMYIFCGGSPFGNLWDKLIYYKTRLRQRLSQEIFKRTQNKYVAERAISRAHPEALLAAKKTNADLYIAHNLGALPAAVLAAKYKGAKVGYDAEDMDSGQYYSQNDFMYLLNLLVEQQYFPKTDYFTAASPLIATGYQEMYPYIHPVVINNVFPKTVLERNQQHQHGPLKLFWFSQTVGIQRGIEEVIKAMGIVKKPVSLHLLGDCNEESRALFLKIAAEEKVDPEQIHFYPPILPSAVFRFAEQFDVGLATEIGIPHNRDICLTNKVFTYVQCGLAMIASDTRAQSLFMQEYPQSGLVYQKNDIASLAASINTYIENRNLLQKTKNGNYELGQHTLNWDQEKLQFLSLVKKTLNIA